MFRGIIRPIVRPILGTKIIKRINNCKIDIESKILCDKIYHSEKYKKMDEKLQDIENKIINDNFSHLEEYKTINEKLREINIDASWASFNNTLCLVIIIFWKN
jgi:hypothetical protein